MNRKTVIVIGLLLQILAVFAIFLPSVWLLQTGTRATLRTIPVDPRSIFRGDYVVLDYEAAQGLPQDWQYDKPVYVVLEKNGDVYERVRFTDGRPELSANQICIRGVPEYMRVNFRDIAQYFVPEGEGMALQNAQNTHRLLVDVAVDASCKATITGVRIGPQAALEQPENTFPPFVVPPQKAMSGAVTEE